MRHTGMRFESDERCTYYCVGNSIFYYNKADYWLINLEYRPLKLVILYFLSSDIFN